MSEEYVSAHRLLADALRPLMPASWVIIDHERDVDAADAAVPATVMLKLDEVTRPREAPYAGRLRVAWTVTVATPHLDPAVADPGVYDALLTLLDGIDELGSWVAWTAARKVTVGGDRYGFDITLTTLTKEKKA